MSTTTNTIKCQPIPRIGDKIQLLKCHSYNNSGYENSIWEVIKITNTIISMVQINDSSRTAGSIDFGGPWEWNIIVKDWDE